MRLLKQLMSMYDYVYYDATGTYNEDSLKHVGN